jgi:thioredoxin-like negative regulator of GroEL
MRRGLIAALLVLAAAAPEARAQRDTTIITRPAPRPAPPRAPSAQNFPRPRGNEMRVLIADPENDVTLSQRPIPPLTQDQLDRLHTARELWQSGSVDRARQQLNALLGKVPHHAEVLGELARVHLAAQDFGAIERLGRTERSATRDSLLLGRELTMAYERLGKPREAAQVVLEVWIASPAMATWAAETVKRLSATDARAVRDVIRRGADRYPQRIDLARSLAQLEWRLGDSKAALEVLEGMEGSGQPASMRWGFAEELLRSGTARDSAGAADAFLHVAADTGLRAEHRGIAARRGWEIYRARQAERVGAPLIHKALADLPPERWPADVLSGVLRGLRQAGFTTEARALLEARSGAGSLPIELALEKALADLRDGPPERALKSLASESGRSPEAAFRYAEALFFAGLPDSALALYKRVAEDPRSPFAGAALERMYLIEDAQPRSGLLTFGRIAYEDWRGEPKRALAVAESLYRSTSRSPLWAQTALLLAAYRESAGDFKGALQPLLALADSLPQDRLAPVARQRAGDLYLERLKDETNALAQYEECLARYPRAWNAPEVRRRMEKLRRDRRF